MYVVKGVNRYLYSKKKRKEKEKNRDSDVGSDRVKIKYNIIKW